MQWRAWLYKYPWYLPVLGCHAGTHSECTAESGGGDYALVEELHVLDVPVNEAPRPNGTTDTIGGARKGALGLGLGIGIGDIGGDVGVGVMPTQQAEDVAGLGLDVALYMGPVLYLGVARDHNNVTGHLEVITEPWSGCLRSLRRWQKEDAHKITTVEICKSGLAEVEELEVAVDEGIEELIERSSLGGLLENDVVTGGDLGIRESKRNAAFAVHSRGLADAADQAVGRVGACVGVGTDALEVSWTIFAKVGEDAEGPMVPDLATIVNLLVVETGANLSTRVQDVRKEDSVLNNRIQDILGNSGNSKRKCEVGWEVGEREEKKNNPPRRSLPVAYMNPHYAFIEFRSADAATYALNELNGHPFDAKHTSLVNRFTDIEKFTDLDEMYVEPQREEYLTEEHLRARLANPQGRSPLKTIDISFTPHAAHNKIYELNYTSRGHRSVHISRLFTGGQSDYTAALLSNFKPASSTLSCHLVARADRSGGEHLQGPTLFLYRGRGQQHRNMTGHLLRTFPSILPEGEGAKKQMAWPALKWSPDDKYTARLTPGQQISVYELPSMGLQGKMSLKIGRPKSPTNLRVSHCSTFPVERFSARKICLRGRIGQSAFIDGTMCKLYWQNQGDFLCVRVDRHTKTKKSIFCNLEIFCVHEKDFPVEVVELNDTVTDFSWEPKGERFAIVSSSDPNLGNPGPGLLSRRTSASQLDRSKNDFKLLRTLAGRTTNTIRWSPRGRHVVLATVGSTSKSELEFWDLDFNSDDVVKKDQPKEEWNSGIQQLGVAPLWRDGRRVGPERAIENGYAIWDFRGQEIEKRLLDRFKQFLWRPHTPSLLTKEQKRTIRRNLKEYARAFDEADAAEETSRKRAVDEWRVRVAEDIAEVRPEREPHGGAAAARKEQTSDSVCKNSAPVPTSITMLSEFCGPSGMELQLAFNSLLRLKRAIEYEGLESEPHAEPASGDSNSDVASPDGLKQQIDTILSLLGSKLELSIDGSQDIWQDIWTKLTITLEITCAGFIVLKPISEERIAATASLGQNELWSSANLHRHLHLLGNVIPRKTEASSHAWIDAFFFRASAMLPPDRHMILNMEQIVPAMTTSPLSFPGLSGLVDYFAIVANQRIATALLKPPFLHDPKLFSSSSFFVIEAKLFNPSAHVSQAVCGLYACGKLLQKKVLRGALTNGHNWIFLLVKLNDDYEGASYHQSTMIQLETVRDVDDQLVIREPWPDLIAAILSYWTHLYSTISQGHKIIAIASYSVGRTLCYFVFRQEIKKRLLDRFKQFLWRPWAPSLLMKEQKQTIWRKTRRRRRSVWTELVAQWKRAVDKWNAWRVRVAEDIAEVRPEREPHGGAAAARKEKVEEEEDKEEIEVRIDEVIEFEEVVE
ncbi:eukaryotic translation initiation factor eIF2A-domain-containing protein [Lactarius deliciosus]|nr:eukaryotic translation initiation factor eIF2A-domain-containing protein [Lactarius deliciosus]